MNLYMRIALMVSLIIRGDYATSEEKARMSADASIAMMINTIGLRYVTEACNEGTEEDCNRALAIINGERPMDDIT